MQLHRIFSCACLAWLCAATDPALAALGETPSDFGVPAQRQPQAAGVTALVSALPSGTRVTEYAGTDGKVFAVAWRGPFLPDFNRLLGPAFNHMRSQAMNKPKAGSGPLRVDSPALQLYSGGTPRNFSGRAWLPASLPAGFDVETLQ